MKGNDVLWGLEARYLSPDEENEPVENTRNGSEFDNEGEYKEINVNNVKQGFRWIEAGSFLMGSPLNEPERDKDELQHQVTLTHGYWLADTACTQALWQAVMEKNPANFQEDLNNPVEQVSWDDVQEFLSKLNQAIPELNARLPTEAEWEYACRAGTITQFSFGDNITPEQVNYDGNYPYNNAAKGLDRGKTVAVKSLPPNAWGLYEMHGNVLEWCNDWYGDYANESVTNPTGATEGTSRVLRGGSWYFIARYARSADRSRSTPDFRSNRMGFRFALGQAVNELIETQLNCAWSIT
jgi:sulfatase modifying factor 1